jgi:hypothetical protein
VKGRRDVTCEALYYASVEVKYRGVRRWPSSVTGTTGEATWSFLVP